MEDDGHRERLAALGAVAAGVAHEISSPISAVMMSLEELRERLAQNRMKPEEIRQILDDSLASMEVVLDLVKDLRALGRRQGDVPPEVVDLAALVRQVLRLTVPRELLVEIDDPEEIPLLWLPRTRLMQIVTNLVTNAVHAMRSHPRALHRLRVSIRTDESSLMLAIADTGGGIAEADLSRVFDDFYTTKDPSSGTGLGLPLSRRIVRELGGDLTLDSVLGEGTIAMVFLPLALRTGSVRPKKRLPRVLIVEEDAAQLKVLERLLMPDFELLSARSGREALDLLSSGARVQLMVYGRGVRAGDASLRDVLTRCAPALLARTVLLDDVPHEQLCAALQAIDISGPLDLGPLSERSPIG